MDALTCKSASRCATCHHFVKGRCQLEAELDLFLDPVPAPRRSAIPVTLAWQDARAPALAEA